MTLPNALASEAFSTGAPNEGITTQVPVAQPARPSAATTTTTTPGPAGPQAEDVPPAGRSRNIGFRMYGESVVGSKARLKEEEEEAEEDNRLPTFRGTAASGAAETRFMRHKKDVRRPASEDDESDPLSKFRVNVTVTRDGKTIEEKLDPAQLAHLYAQKQAALDQMRNKYDYVSVPEWVHVHPKIGCYLAEFFGTFSWVLTFTLTSVRNRSVFSLTEGTDLTCISVGFMFTSTVFMLGYISGGHFNPAISLAVFFVRSLDLVTFICYLLCQLGAALAAGLVAMAIQGGSDIFVPSVTTDYVSKGVFSELIFTFAIVLVVLNIGYSRQSGNFFYGFAIGMTVTAGSACAGTISGGSFNPAAATGLQLAMCLASNCDALKTFWVYWIAPIAGSILASFFFSQMAQPENTQILQDYMVFKDSSNNTVGTSKSKLSVRERNKLQAMEADMHSANTSSSAPHPSAYYTGGETGMTSTNERHRPPTTNVPPTADPSHQLGDPMDQFDHLTDDAPHPLSNVDLGALRGYSNPQVENVMRANDFSNYARDPRTNQLAGAGRSSSVDVNSLDGAR